MIYECDNELGSGGAGACCSGAKGLRCGNQNETLNFVGMELQDVREKMLDSSYRCMRI